MTTQRHRIRPQSASRVHAAFALLAAAAALSGCRSQTAGERALLDAMSARGDWPSLEVRDEHFFNSRRLTLETDLSLIRSPVGGATEPPKLHAHVRIIASGDKPFPPGLVVKSIGFSRGLQTWSADLAPSHRPDVPLNVGVFAGAAPVPGWPPGSVADALVFFETSDGRALGLRARNQTLRAVY